MSERIKVLLAIILMLAISTLFFVKKPTGEWGLWITLIFFAVFIFMIIGLIIKNLFSVGKATVSTRTAFIISGGITIVLSALFYYIVTHWNP